MPDGGAAEFALAEFIEGTYAVGEAVAGFAAYAEAAAVAAAAYMSYESSVRARDAYNSSLRDRYAVQRTATGQRALVLGRARVSGPVAFMQSYGANQSTLAMVVALAAHQCDAIETIYFNDLAIVLDVNGNVIGVESVEHFSCNTNSPLQVKLATAAQSSTIVATAQYADATITLGTSLANDNITLTLTGMRASGVGDVKVTYLPTQCQYTPNQRLDQRSVVSASSSTGSYGFPAATSAYSNTGGQSPLVGGTVTVGSVNVVQSVNGVQTSIPFSCQTDSNGFATGVSWSGATIGAQIWVTYQSNVNASRARIRTYLGAPGQVADAKLISNLPGEWTSAHVGNGITYLVCEFDYDESSYPSGLPSVSATVRGLKVLDPRTNTTAWSNNPALLTLAYATHPLGAKLSQANVDLNSVIAAANVCDAPTVFNLGSFTKTQPLYQAGYVATKDQKPQDVLNDLTMAMGGRWVISGNQLRVKAGAFSAPVAAIDASWLTSVSSVTMQPLPPRQNLYNSVQGTFADETNDYRAVLYPRQTSSALVTSDGRELDLDVSYLAVTNTVQAQYLSACSIRYNRAGLSLTMSCNMKAFPLEVFDVVTLTLPRFGFVAQTFEVTDTTFTPEGLVALTLKFISPSIWAVDNSYTLASYAPLTTVPSPWNVNVPVLGIPQTGTAQLLKQTDGTIVSRIYLPFSGIDSSVIATGYVDVAYSDTSDPSGLFSTVTVSGSSTGAYLAPVKDGHTYVLKARARNSLAASAWSQSAYCTVAGQSAAPSAVANLAWQVQGGNVVLTWTPNIDADYKETAVRYGPIGTTGNTWSSAGVLEAFRGAASYFSWPAPAAGAYQILVEHFNASGVGTAAASVNVTAPNPSAAFINANLSLGAVVVPADASGNVTSFVGASTQITILVSGVDDTANWTITPSATAGLTFTNSNPTFTITGLDTAHPNGVLTLTCTKAGMPTTVRTFVVTKASAGMPGAAGSAGAPAQQYATVNLWQWGNAAPAAPTATSVYNWTTGAMTNYTGANGWSTTVPANPGTPGLTLYVASILTNTTAGATTSTVSWAGASNVAAWTQNGLNGSGGAAGASGVQSATGTVYQWAATIPTGPAGAATYTWSTGLFGAAPSGWSLTTGTSTSPGFTLWAANVHVVDSAANTTTAFNWSSASIAARGYAGATGPGAFSLQGNAYCTIVGAVATKTGGTQGQWDTGFNSLQGYTGGATMSFTATDTVHAIVAGLNTDPTSGVDYTTIDYGLYLSSTGTIGITESGVAIGTTYGNYVAGDVFSVTYDNTRVRYSRNGTVFYTSTNAASMTAGLTLYLDASIRDSGGTTTCTFASVGSVGAAGPAGAAGAAGPAGPTGAQATIAYTVVASSKTPASTPTTSTVVGNNLPATNTWGMSETWSTTVPGYTAGQTVYQTNGIYSPMTANTTWGLPYISALKVGSLSAISANLGSITAGDIFGADIRAGSFAGWAWPTSGGGFYLGPNGLLLGNNNVGGFWQFNADGSMSSNGMSMTAAGVLTINAIVVDGSGKLQGIGSGAGTPVANALLTPSIAAAATTAVWNSVSNAPQDTTNMVATSSFDGLTNSRTWNGGASPVVAVSGQAFGAAMAVTGRDNVEYASQAPVSAGEALFFSCWVNAANATVAVSFGGEFENSSGTPFNWVPAFTVPAGTAGWQYLTGSVVVPAGSAYALPWVQMAGSTGSNLGIAYVTRLYMGRSQPGATVGATWGVNLANIPGTLQAPGPAGLYVTSGALGYWNGSSWATYMDNGGDFYLGGSGGSLTYSPGGGLSINGSGTFSGAVYAASGSFAGNLNGAGGTFTGTLSAANGSFSGTLTGTNVVVTGNLVANAITYPVSSYTAGGTNSANSGTIQSVGITTVGGPVFVTFTSTVLATGSYGVGVAITRNGSLVYNSQVSFGAGGTGTPVAVTVTDFGVAGTPGTYTYAATFTAGSGTTAVWYGRSISAIEYRR